MTTIAYAQGKMLHNAIGCAVLAAAGGYLAGFTDWHWQLRLMGGLLALCLPFVSAALFLRLRSGADALVYDGQQIKISTFYRQAGHRWSDVRAIQRETLTQSSGFGLVKQDLAHYLVITVADGAALEEYRIQEELLALPKSEMQALADDLQNHLLAALRGHTSPAVSLRETPQAMISGVPLSPAPAVSSFGRKGL
jgi:hypothetical protein